MKATILGSGTGHPTIRRSACSVLVEIGANRLLFDLGVGTLRRLFDAGSSFSEITHLFFSHSHPDHTGEFASFLFASKYPESLRRCTPFIVMGKGVTELYAGYKQVYGKWIELEPEILNLIDVNPTGLTSFEFSGFTVKISAMPHIDSSIGYRIECENGKSLVYTGDTDFSDKVIAFAKGADLLITECSFPDNMKMTGHLTPSLAGQIASEAKVGSLVLTHMYPECEKVDISAQCRKSWTGPLAIAEDLLTLCV